MTGEAHSPDDPTAAANSSVARYAGPVGATRTEAVHWTRADGSVASVRVHTTVNATTDPELAERLVTGNLNWVQLGGSDELQYVPTPVVYHDEEARLFLLVLPEEHRTREVAQRASLLSRLAADAEHAIPAYVLGFRVVYSADLASVLEALAEEPALPAGEESELADREEAIVSREAKLAEWEERLKAEQAELEVDLKQREILDQPVSEVAEAELGKRTQELDRRENELREVERHLMERQLEVERQEKILQLRAKKLERKQQAVGQDASGTDSPTRVADRESMELAARESAGFAGTDTSGLILDGPPADLADQAMAATEAGAPPQEANIDGETDRSHIEAELEAAGTPKTEPRKRRRSLKTTPLARAMRAAAEEEAPEELEAVEADGDAGEEEVTGLNRVDTKGRDPDGDFPGDEPAYDEPTDDVPAYDEPTDDGDLDAEPAGEEEIAGPGLPEELSGWLTEEFPQPTRYLRDGVLHLAATLPAERAELFVGMDPAAVFQLHELPTYPLLVLGLVAEGGEDMAELDPPAAFWPLDVRSQEDLGLMDRLAEDFRFVLEIYDEELFRVTSSEVHFPLEENVRVVRERALHWMEELELEPDLGAALGAFGDPEYRWLPVGELPFGPLGFDELSSAADVVEALPAIGTWSQPDHEDELILLRSFPASRWRRMCLEVLRSAIDFGIWMEDDLRRRALDAGYATSRKDLLRGCLAGFERVCVGELPSDLTPAQEHENWTALLTEAEGVGVVVDPGCEALAEQAAKRQRFAESEDNGVEEDGVEVAPDQGVGYEEEYDDPGVARLEDEEAYSEEGYGGDVQEVDDADVQEVDDGDVQEVGSGDLILADESPEEPQSGDAPADSPEEPAEGGLDEQDLRELSPMELLALLGDDHARLEASLELCRRREIQAVSELFATLEQMRKSEVIRLLPQLVGLGPEVVPSLVTSLRSGSTIIRQGAALALGALASDTSAEDLVELLLDEPTEIWVEVAQALGDLGPGALMTVASQIRHAEEPQFERLAHAMACIASESGQQELLVELTGSRDEDAATVANRAVEILSERLDDDLEGDELPPRDNPALFFSRRFFDARAKDEAELGEDDILEQEDIVENGDVMAEEVLPEEG